MADSFSRWHGLCAVTVVRLTDFGKGNNMNKKYDPHEILARHMPKQSAPEPVESRDHIYIVLGIVALVIGAIGYTQFTGPAEQVSTPPVTAPAMPLSEPAHKEADRGGEELKIAHAEVVRQKNHRLTTKKEEPHAPARIQKDSAVPGEDHPQASQSEHKSKATDKAAKPPVKEVSTSAVFNLALAMDKSWFEKDRASYYLPSDETDCSLIADRMACRTGDLESNGVTYLTRSIITSSGSTVTIRYYNLIKAGKNTRAGWTKEKKISCKVKTADHLVCKNNAGSFTVTADL